MLKEKYSLRFLANIFLFVQQTILRFYYIHHFVFLMNRGTMMPPGILPYTV